ncbi:SGNH/GDSL hydrolase family protein [Mycoplasmopsis fermentans]|uniref:SGNH hydrolase-type esterase domain-containing protein n=1 Tax=Mycoplasmopsis fermentans (strain M64) TaxID=943945 RepID=A0AB32XBD8_MYCFM|nr:SGNH/GDSL hydrolase family protein [Mycoplasmopsis fermentans]ADV34311.1 Hypothetical Protein MfeM64YM_0307 [Mycoplasmopsis fermentans M64]
MKIKLKQTLIILSTTLVGTIALATGLSFLPTKDKTIPRGKQSFNDDHKNYNDPNIPNLPGNNVPTKNPKPTLVLKNRPKSANAITKENSIKYLALGDSISAGFNAQLDKDYPGQLVNSKIEGLSFPTYLASFFQQLADKKLESFDNKAVSGTTFKQWNLLLNYDPNKPLDPKDLAELNKYFGTDLVNIKNDLIAKIKNANLITVTLGANDFLKDLLFKMVSNMPILDLIKQIKNKNLDYNMLVSHFDQVFRTLFEQLENRQKQFIQTIKSLNDKVNINFIAYPLPLTFIMDLIDKAINKGDTNNALSIGQTILDLLNKKLKYTAISQKTYYINPYQSSFWKQNLKLLTPNIFDIHPSSFGYKKMAMEVFVKLINPSRDINKYHENKIEWDNKYLQSDQDSFEYQIEVKNPFEKIKTIFKNNYDGYLKEKDSFFLAYENQLNEGNYINRVLNNNGLADFLFVDLINSMFKSKIYETIDPNRKLEKFMHRDDYANQKSLRDWFFNGQFMAKFLYDVQKQLFEQDWDQDNLPGAKDYQFKYLLEAIKTQTLKEERIIEFITSFCSSSVITTQKDELKTILEEIFSNIVAYEVKYEDMLKLVKSFYNENISKYISQNDLASLLKLVLNTKSIKSAVGDLVVELINSAPEYAKCKSINELFNVFISNKNNQNTIKKFIESIVNDLLSQNEFKQIVLRLASKIIKQYPELFKDIDENNLTNLIYESLSLGGEINNALGLVTKFVNSLLNELTTTNIKEFKFDNVIKNTLTEIKTLFDKDNWQESTFNIIKIVAKSNLYKNRSTISQLIKNIFNYLNTKNSFAKRIVDLFYDKNQAKISEYISKENLTSLFEKVFKTEELSNLISQLVSDLLKTNQTQLMDVTNFFDAIKVIFKNFVNTSAYDYISPLIKKVFEFPEAKDLFKKAMAKIPAQEAKNLNDRDVADIVSFVLDNNEFKDILQDFLVKGIFGDAITIEKLKDANNIIKSWLANKGSVDYIVLKASKFILDVSQQSSIKGILTSLIYEALSKERNLVKDIDQQEMENFIGDFLTIIPSLDEEFRFIKDVLTKIFNELKATGKAIDFKKVMSEFAKCIKNKLFNKNDWEKNTVKLIKIAITKKTMNKHQAFLRKFVKNILVYVSEDIALGKKLFKSLSEKAHKIIDKHIDENDFNNMFIDLFQRTEGLQRIIDNILDSLFSDIDSYQNANSLIDILKIYVMPQDRADRLAKNLEDVLKEFLKNEALHKLLRGLFEENVAPYGIDPKSPGNKALVDDLLANLHTFFVDLKILPNLANSMVDSFKKYNNFNEIIKNIEPILVNGLKLKEYSFVATILKNNIVNKHKESIRDDINKVIAGITSKINLVNKFIDDFNLIKPIKDMGLSETKARDFLTQVIQSQNLKTIIDVFVKELLDKNLEYAQLNSWLEAISKFMSSPSALIIKGTIKQYITELFEKNEEVAFTIGKLIANGWRKEHWTNSENDDIIIQKFIRSFGIGLLKTNILDDIVDSIFERLKRINTYGFEKLIDNLRDAAKEGALKFISEGGKVRLSKIFDQIPLIRDLLAKVPQKEFSDFLNLAFSSTPKNDTEGLFKVMFNSDKGTSKFEVGIGASGIIDILKGKVGDLVSAIASPLVKEFFKQASEQNYSDHNTLRKTNTGFQALWRFYSFLASVLYSNTPSGLFWNGTSLTAEAYLMDGFVKAFKDNVKDYKTALLAKYGDKSLIGFNNSFDPLDYYLSGMTTVNYWTGTLHSRSNSLNDSRYGSDHVLTYIYYKDKKDSKFTNKKFKQALIEYMHQGYMPYK